MKLKHLILLSIICCSQSVFGQKANQQPKTSGNPVFPGWYADPEGVVFGDEYWIYPTYSAPYDEQTFMDAFSSKDLGTGQSTRKCYQKRILVGLNVLCGHLP